jgi:2-polyprenyl-6-methoxyphenol hydroxylase-like FAD-dependent oxidoreductase
VRASAGFSVIELGAPIDVLWFRLSRRPSDAADTMGRFERGRLFVLINRGEHWQCAYVIPKGSAERLRAAGIDAFRAVIASLAPFAADRVGELVDWDAVKLLVVSVDRLPRWYRDGLICIGDAAHAMSPVGGVGINGASPAAVATATRLAEPLRAGRPAPDDLHRVQRRRELPTKVTQWFQVMVQQRILARVLGDGPALSAPWIIRLLARFPVLRRIPARLVGMGIRPEHVQTPEVAVR